MFYLANKTLGSGWEFDGRFYISILSSPRGHWRRGWHEGGERGEVAVVADSCNILLPNMAGGIFSSHK